MSKIVMSDRMLNALTAAGILRPDDLVTRVVIDLKVNEVPVIHVQRIGDERLLNVVPGLDGVEVVREPAPEQTA